jgi:prepilin-type processing-associated H-X9-DG protein
VVIAIIAMLLAILMPALSKVKKIAQRVICGTNLKGLGTAQMVYAQDYNDDYTVQSGRGKHAWGWYTPGFQAEGKNWSNDSSITIGASLYLLVREADVSPKSFVCPSGAERDYDGKNDNNLDIVELWDFGAEDLATGSGYPYEYVSYSYHQPYGETGGKSVRAADGARSASFAVMADKNPYLDPRISLNIGDGDSSTWRDGVSRMQAYYMPSSTFTESSWEVKIANAYAHERDGQNVLFGDGHASYEKTTDVGIKNDAIYLPIGGSGDTEAPVRRGYFGALSGAPVHVLASTQAATSSDSFLINDDVHDPDSHP